MKNIKFSRLFAAALFVACLALTACKNQPEESPKAIEGTWVNAYSGGKSYYKISGSEFDNWNENNGTISKSYAGKEVKIVETNSSSGIIYFKFTRAADSNWNYVTDPAQAPDVGKWYAVSYKNLNGKNVKICGAWKQGGQTSCATLEAAKQEFTAGNGYFPESGYSDCVKQ